MTSSLRKIAFFVLALAAGGVACAQAWPSKPVHLVVPVGAGSFGDILSRAVAEELQTVFKQPFVVENKAGASGMLAADFVAKAPADGYTLLLMTNSAHSANPHLFKKLPYEPIRSFTPIVRICYVPFVLMVGQDSPIRSLEDLLARGKAAPGKLTYGYANTTSQVAAAALSSLTAINAVAVPYKASPQALTEAVTGRVDFLFNDAGSSASLLKAGRLRPLAVTSAKRSALFPELPTVEEGAKLPGFSVAAWAGLGGPADLPGDVVAKVSQAVIELARRPAFQEKLMAMGAEAAPAAPAEFGAYLAQQLDLWGSKVRQAGIEKE